MRICLDIRTATKGGTSTFAENFVHHLLEQTFDHDIRLLVNYDGTIHPGRLDTLARVPYRHRMMEFAWAQSRLPRQLRREQMDVYHSLKHVGPLRSPIPTVYRVAAVGQFCGRYPQKTFDHIYWAHAARVAYQRADLLIAVSNYVRNGLVEYLDISPERVVTVHNGVDSRFRRLTPDSVPAQFLTRRAIDRPFILCVGNLVPVKNLSTAIRAYQRLTARLADPPLLVLAGGTQSDHSRELRTLAEQLRVDGSVRFLGHQSLEELLFLYNAAQLLVHPSLHEGFSFTILEAMSCGVPLIASSTTSIPEAAGDAACYYDDPCDAEQLSRCIEMVLESSELRQQLSTQAVTRASQFTWDRCVKETLAAYQRL